jgi:hypothetical protein
MKKTGILLCLIFCALLFPAYASSGGIEERVKSLEAENAQLKEMLIKLQQRLDAIEGKTRMEKKIGKPEDKTAAIEQQPEKIEYRVAAIEKRLDDGWLPSLKGKKFRLGGELEIEYRKTQSERSHPAGTTNIPYGQFQIDKFDLNIEARPSDDITIFAQIEAEPDDKTELDEAHVTFSNLFFDSYLRIGLQERFIRPSRKTETYPLVGNALWRDKDIGIELGGDLKPFYYRLSLSNGLALGKKEIGEDDSFDEILQDDGKFRDYNNSKEFGIGIGYKDEIIKGHKIDILLFSYFSKLSSDDIAFLKSRFSGYASNEDTKNFYGGNIEYKFKGLNLFGQYIHARDGEIKRDMWYVQPSYKFNVKGIKYLSAIEPLYRYDRYDVSHAPSATKPLSWDRKRNTFSVIADIIKDLKLKLEYNLNDEETGGQKVKNNEFVGQMEIKF